MSCYPVHHAGLVPESCGLCQFPGGATPAGYPVHRREGRRMAQRIRALRPAGASSVCAAVDAFLSSPRVANPNTRRAYAGALEPQPCRDHRLAHLVPARRTGLPVAARVQRTPPRDRRRHARAEPHDHRAGAVPPRPRTVQRRRHRMDLLGSGTAQLLPRLLRGRDSGPVFLSERRPASARRPAAKDLCLTTGRARLGYDRARRGHRTTPTIPPPRLTASPRGAEGDHLPRREDHRP